MEMDGIPNRMEIGIKKGTCNFQRVIGIVKFDYIKLYEYNK